MAQFLVTGAARLLRNRVSEMRIEQGHAATGVDNLNNTCELCMPEFRLRKLHALPGFTFQKPYNSERCSVGKIPAFDGMCDIEEYYRTGRT